MTAGELPQFVVDKRRELFQGALAALPPFEQQARNRLHWRHRQKHHTPFWRGSALLARRQSSRYAARDGSALPRFTFSPYAFGTSLKSCASNSSVPGFKRHFARRAWTVAGRILHGTRPYAHSTAVAWYRAAVNCVSNWCKSKCQLLCRDSANPYR